MHATTPASWCEAGRAGCDAVDEAGWWCAQGSRAGACRTISVNALAAGPSNPCQAPLHHRPRRQGPLGHAPAHLTPALPPPSSPAHAGRHPQPRLAMDQRPPEHHRPHPHPVNPRFHRVPVGGARAGRRGLARTLCPGQRAPRLAGLGPWRRLPAPRLLQLVRARVLAWCRGLAVWHVSGSTAGGGLRLWARPVQAARRGD